MAYYAKLEYPTRQIVNKYNRTHGPIEIVKEQQFRLCCSDNMSFYLSTLADATFFESSINLELKS